SMMTVGTYAADGSDLWFANCKPENTQTPVIIKTSGIKADTTLQIAKRELETMGLHGKVYLIVDNRWIRNSDAYSLTSYDGNITIRSASAQGLLYGTYDLLRRKNLGEDIYKLNVEESPAYMIRALNHWDNPDGSVERGYAGYSLWDWKQLPDGDKERYEKYARACASVGINATVINNVNAKPMMLAPEMLNKVKALADIFRPYGIRTYMSINFASPKALGGLPTADPLDPEVQKWWKEKIDEIYKQIPDFGGFLVKANSEGEPGPGDYGRSHSEGANMLADAIAPHGGVVMWRAFVYNPSSPDRAKQAFEEFTPLDGEFGDNVIIQIKNGPVDFQPREPISPLFGAMPDTQQMVEFQITQEYLGQSNHLVYLAPLFKECLDTDTHRGEGTVASVTVTPHHGISAIAGVANIGDDANWCGHDFAQANWYAFGRLAWDPDLSSERIADEWIGQTFTTDERFTAPVKQMMMDSREACVDYMMPMGLHHLFAGNHHYGPEPWYYPEGIRPDWTPSYYHKATVDSIGFDRTFATGSGATRQYADPVYEVYEKDCPTEYLLWFNRKGWNERLSNGNTVWEEMCRHYSDGVDKARQFQKVWDNVGGYIDEERYKAVRDKLKIQTHDAQWWKDACLLYFQEINGLPFPEDMERPVYDLDMLKEVQIPLGLHGCPTRNMLP
ncbi:MAG: alpha-glucuronidase, partial [Muribaculaceae bacterium]|nr:alpha-glucuronidase [Muribaculaceae bacterium]